MTTPAPAFPDATILGYPRIGRRRELKRAVEAFWAGSITAEELERQAAELRATTRERLANLGLARTGSAIPETFSFYDQVLDAAVAVGAVPARFAGLADEQGRLDLAAYFTIARGVGDDAPLEMTKWFDSNYHYLVPEIGPDTVFSLHAERILAEFAEAKAAGFTTRPVIVGPVTFLLLAKAADGAPAGFAPIDRLAELVPVYEALLEQLAAAGAEWVQLDEPALVSESIDVDRARVIESVGVAYDALGALDARPAVFVAAPYGSLDDALPALAATPVEAIGLDLVRGSLPDSLDPVTAESLAAKTLVAGVIDGHNIWRGDLAAAFDRVAAIQHLSPAVSVSTSTSLLHVPHDVADEDELDARLVSWLAFADQKVGQVAVLGRGLVEGRDAIEESSPQHPLPSPTATPRPECACRRCATDSPASPTGTSPA